MLCMSVVLFVTKMIFRDFHFSFISPYNLSHIGLICDSQHWG